MSDATITLEPGDKPLNKAEAYHLARLLITEPDSVTPAELRGLLLHFAPTAGRVPKTAQEYVAQFVAGTGEKRYGMQYLYSDGERLWGCDGHSAAWCPTDLAPGFYHPRTGDSVELEGTYPNVARTIPERQAQAPLILDDWGGEERRGVAGPDLWLRSPGGVPFQRQLIQRAVKGADSVVYQEPARPKGAIGPGPGPLRGSVILKKEGGAAQFVVMPLRS